MDMSLTTPAVTAPNDSSPVRFRDRVRSRSGLAELFLFALGDERFAVDVRAVDEVLESPAITPVPGAPHAVAGVCRYGEGSLGVVQAGTLLGVDGALSRSVLVMRRGDERVGLLVDDVEDVVLLDLSTLGPPPYDADDFLLAVHWDREVLTAIIDARALVAAAAIALRGVTA